VGKPLKAIILFLIIIDRKGEKLHRPYDAWAKRPKLLNQDHYKDTIAMKDKQIGFLDAQVALARSIQPAILEAWRGRDKKRLVAVLAVTKNYLHV
jgi:hypothetical protein